MADMRELLFGDVPLSRWAGTGGEVPWSWFADAAEHIVAGRPDQAQLALSRVLAEPGLESRQYLQAWHALRGLGVEPEPAQAKQVLGVVLDISVEGGLDTLAAYADHSCRYLNHGGGAIIWDQPDPAIDQLVDQLLRAGRTVADQIGPWTGERPPLPAGVARLSVLCPSGLHFGQAPGDALRADPLARATLDAGTELLVALVARNECRR
jgi:hypothetical protein